MFRTLRVLSLSLILIAAVFSSALAESSRDTLPNDFGIEIGGRSVLYTFTYQRQLSPYIGLEAGISAFGGGSDLDDDNALILFFPIGGRFYPINKNGSPFVAAGVNIVNVKFDSGPFDDDASGTFMYAGLGFEFRAEMGLLFRGTAYGLINDGNFFIWPGLYIGYAF